MNKEPKIAQARIVLRNWLLIQGEDALAATIDSWEGSSGPEASAFVPDSGRSNRMYLVRGDRVIDFALSEMSIAEAILLLDELE